MIKKDVYNVITNIEFNRNTEKMLAMRVYLKSQGLEVSNGKELFLLTKKVEELIEVLNMVGEINLKTC